MAEFDPQKYPSLPSNYVTIVHLKERWLKEKERKQKDEKENQGNEEEKKYPVLQNHQNRIANGGTHSRAPVGKNLYKRENRSGKGWREVGLIAKEPNSKGAKITVPVVEEGVDGTRGKKEMGYVGDRRPRVERDMGKVSTIDVAVVSVENGGKESSKGKCKWNSENQEVKEVANDRVIPRQNCGVGFWGNKNSWRKMGDKADSVEQSGQKHNAGKEKVSVDAKERTNEKVRVSDAFCAYGDNEVASVCTVEVVGGNKVDREIAGQNCGVRYRGKKHSWRKMANKVGEVSDKAESAEQSGQERNAEKEKVSFDLKERTNEKVRVGSTFRSYSDKEVEEVDTVFMVEVVEENKVDKEITGQKCRVRYQGRKHSRRKMGYRAGDVSDKADGAEQSGQAHNAEKEKVSVDVKERTNEKLTLSGAFHAYSDKEAEEVATACPVEVVEENKVDREITGQKHRVVFRGKKQSWRKMGGRVGFSGKKHSWRQIGDRVGEVSNKANGAELSGQENNVEKENVSVDVEERTNEKVRLKGVLCSYDDKQVEEVAGVCMVEAVEENKVDKEIEGQKCRVGHKGKKHSRRKMANRVGEVSDKADSVEQSGQEINAEKGELSVDVKEKTNEKARVRGSFHAYSDKSKDVVIHSEDSLKMTVEGDLGDLSLADKRYGHGRSIVGMYGDKWRYESSRRYDPRKILKQRDKSFAWIKKGKSSNGNVAEI